MPALALESLQVDRIDAGRLDGLFDLIDASSWTLPKLRLQPLRTFELIHLVADDRAAHDSSRGITTSVGHFAREVFFFRGTLAPAFRASDRPIAIACFRLLTVVPDLPLFKVPRFILCIARSTFFSAAFFFVAITRYLVDVFQTNSHSRPINCEVIVRASKATPLPAAFALHRQNWLTEFMGCIATP
jgi:hypothetical protein